MSQDAKFPDDHCDCGETLVRRNGRIIIRGELHDALCCEACDSIYPTAGETPSIPCSTPSDSVDLAKLDVDTWCILMAYVADEDHNHGAGISEGRLTEILSHRLGWGRFEARAAWFDAVKRGTELIEQDHQRMAPIIAAKVAEMRARIAQQKATDPSSSNTPEAETSPTSSSQDTPAPSPASSSTTDA